MPFIPIIVIIAAKIDNKILKFVFSRLFCWINICKWNAHTKTLSSHFGAAFNINIGTYPSCLGGEKKVAASDGWRKMDTGLVSCSETFKISEERGRVYVGTFRIPYSRGILLALPLVRSSSSSFYPLLFAIATWLEKKTRDLRYGIAGCCRCCYCCCWLAS